jgi:hypothetical protein
MRERIYVIAPFRAKTEMERQRNIWNAKRAGEELAKRGFAPIVPHVAVAFMYDSLPEEQMMEICLSLLASCSRYYVERGTPTQGMILELEFADIKNISRYEWE